MPPFLPSTKLALESAMAVNASAAALNMTVTAAAATAATTFPLIKTVGYPAMDFVTTSVHDASSHTLYVAEGADAYAISYYLDRVSNTTEPTAHDLQLARRSGPDIAQVAVDAHNRIRAKHGVQPLRWNQELAGYAQIFYFKY